MTGSRTPSRRRHGLVAVAVLAVLVAAAGIAVAAGPVPGRHDDHGRFSDRSQGFPPQPVDLTGAAPVTPVTPSAWAGAAAGAARAVAADDAIVTAALGADPQLIGVEDVAPKGSGQQAHRVTWYAGGRDVTVRATVRNDRVSDVEEIPAADWQPPLTTEEEARAEQIAREGLVAEGHSSAADLQGFTIPAMDADGSYPGSRMAYVSFHDHVDARPELVAWVDLSVGAVVRSRVEPPGPSPAEPFNTRPSHFGQVDGGADVPRRGSVDWHGWSFDYDVSDRMDGVSLADLEWQGTLILARASMPAMTVFYDDDACGPFVDRLGDELTPVDWADGAEVVLREFTQHGQEWLEVGVLDTIGNYVLYQVFYLSADGELDLHTFAKGVQCTVDHLHYPFWRLDFDVAGAAGDQVTRRSPSGIEVVATEFDAGAGDAVEHDWAVRDRTTGHRVLVAFDDGSWNVPGQVLPEATYDANRVYGRRYSAADAGPWMDEAVIELGGNQTRPLDGQDLVMWYRGFLPHADAEGPDLWHSTGVRLTVELARDHYVRPR